MEFEDWKKTIIENVKLKINKLKSKNRSSYVTPILADAEVKTYLKKLHQKFVIVPIDKASNNFAFICKKFYVSKILSELGVDGKNTSNLTYKNVQLTKEEIIKNNEKYLSSFDLKLTENDHSLPIMYWLPKLHKTPIGARFIVASKHCSTKPLSKTISKVFKMIFKHVENFHNKSLYYTDFKKFWVVENSFPILEKLNVINTRKRAKSISTFDFSTLYTTIPHNLLIKVLSEIVKFVFKSKVRRRIGFSNSSLYWTTKGVGKRYFTENRLIQSMTFLIKNCFFTVGNLVFKQDIGIPMGIDPAPYWANLFLYFFESKHVQQLVSKGSKRAYKYHGTSRFIDDLCAINDGNEFSKSYKNIYPKELELKLEHHGKHATFLDLDIKIEHGIFIYKLFDKRDKFPFFIVRMPHLQSNIPSSIFYGSIFSEFLRIARCTLRFQDFIPRASELYKRMISQGGINSNIKKQIRKGFQRYPTIFEKYGKTVNDIILEITK